MIAKYAGKCDLTGTAIVAGVTEIEKYGRLTVLAGYATPEAIDGWFAAQTAEFNSIIAELRTVTGREFPDAETKFADRVNRQRSDKTLQLDFVARNTRDEVAQMQRNLDGKRSR